MAKARTDTNEAIAPARFSLTIDGVEIAAFSTLVGIVSGVEPDDIAGALLKPGCATTLRRCWRHTAEDAHAGALCGRRSPERAERIG